MVEIGPDYVRDALFEKNFTALTGLPECQWLDVKDGVYPLKIAKGKEELAKDVAAFANCATGGLLLIGFAAVKRDNREFITGVNPVSKDLVNIEQHRSTIQERVSPYPRGVSVEWIACDDDRGILVIDIPAQAEGRLPFAISSPGGIAQSMSVPIRAADGTHWLPLHELRRLVAVGWQHQGGPGTSAATVYEVGAGEPGWKRLFRAAYDEISQQVPLGEAITEVQRQGPGVVQRLGATRGATEGWFLCALTMNHPVIAVAEQVWEGLHAAGGGVPGGDVLSALGMPVGDGNGDRSRNIVDDHVTAVSLRHGRWGPGTLARADNGSGWAWEPEPAISFDVGRDARNWTGGTTPPQLRARAIATLPWSWSEEYEIPAARRRELVQVELPTSALAGAVTVLSRRRGVDLRADSWGEGPNRNGSRALSCSSSVEFAGRSALSCEVMMALPTAPGAAVVTCAELRVEDIDVWAEALAAAKGRAVGPVPRLSIEELLEFFVVAWETATQILPALPQPSPWRNQWTRPPTVELRLSAEQQHTWSSNGLRVPELVDFSAFGEPRDSGLTEMAVTITAAPRLPRETRRVLAERAMVRMGVGSGFLDAADGHLHRLE